MKIWLIALLFIGSIVWGSTTTFKQIDTIQNSTGGSSLSVPASGTTFLTDASSVSFTPVVQVKSANYTILSSDDVIVGTAAITLTLPDCTGLASNHIWFIKNSSSGGSITITAGGANVFDDPISSTSYFLNDPGTAIEIVCNKGSTLYVF